MQINSTSDLRKILVDTIGDIREGKMHCKDATAVASLAGKMLESVRLELDCAKFNRTLDETGAPLPLQLANSSTPNNASTKGKGRKTKK